MRRKKISRDLCLLQRRRRAGQSARNTETMVRLIKQLYTTRRLLNERTVLIQRLRRKVKNRVMETKARPPSQVFVSLHVQPILVYFRFAIIDDDLDQSPSKSWADLLVPPVVTDDPTAISPRQTAIPLHRCPREWILWQPKYSSRRTRRLHVQL